MKALFLTFILTLVVHLSYCQVSSINVQYYLQIQNSTSNGVSPVIRRDNQTYSSFSYLPQEYKEYRVIHIARTDASFDDVYFIDEDGNTSTHSIMQTKPVNVMNMPGQPQRDSFNPHGSNTFDQALISGVSHLISRWIF
ncbi:hypothetical protein [Reichenbachiella ulvae]|uniref:Uncharacterized protein n=1 Tax=Reichenbachiella ulvae TaxID=2980104 RepID=A0ABT3CXH7_9BACT|nr:hypothetical protein [Reichenbachiella ulvae]MCV9388337.1 hypothetical protein [Reichenbachiella ulvae]